MLVYRVEDGGHERELDLGEVFGKNGRSCSCRGLVIG